MPLKEYLRVEFVRDARLFVGVAPCHTESPDFELGVDGGEDEDPIAVTAIGSCVLGCKLEASSRNVLGIGGFDYYVDFELVRHHASDLAVGDLLDGHDHLGQGQGLAQVVSFREGDGELDVLVILVVPF